MKIQLKRSNVLDGGKAKEPTAGQMEYGELAVNYSDDDPAVFLKDSTDTVIRIAGKGAKGLDGDYVNITGDNMTGDLTLGTDKITLDAGDGSASFDGAVGIGTSPTTSLDVKGSASAGYAAQFTNSSASRYAKIYVDSNAVGFVDGNFTNGIEFAYDSQAHIYVNGDKQLTVDGNGNINIKGSITADGVCEAEYFKSVVTGTDSGLYLYKDGGSNANAINISPTTSGGDITTSLGYDGSAEFAGNTQVGGDAKAGVPGTKIEPNGLISVCRNSATAAVFAGYPTGSTVATSFISADGSASFAGAVTVTDNPANGTNVGNYIQNGKYIASAINGDSVFDGWNQSSTTKTITLNANGSATFAGFGQFGAFNQGSANGNGVYISADGQVTAQKESTSSSYLFRGFQGTNEKFFVKANGSANFKGRCDFGSETLANSAVIAKSDEPGSPTIVSQNYDVNSVSRVFEGRNASGVATSAIYANGTITATGYSMASLAQL